MPFLHLPESWKDDITNVLSSGINNNHEEEVKRLRIEKAIENLRKQHKWGDIEDEQYRRERQKLERQIKSLLHTDLPINLPNLERAANLLEDVAFLWLHPGVTHSQREEFIKEVFANIMMGGDKVISIEPKPEYAPLFASIVVDQYRVENRKIGSPPSPPETQTSRQEAH